MEVKRCCYCLKELDYPEQLDFHVQCRIIMLNEGIKQEITEKLPFWGDPAGVEWVEYNIDEEANDDFVLAQFQHFLRNPG